MVKQKVTDLHKASEKRFFERKEILVNLSTEFVWGKLTSFDHKRLEQIFEKRTERTVSEHGRSIMYHFFTLFIHRYENGLRGIEWFYNEKGPLLEPQLREMASNWTKLQFSLVQIVKFSDEIITYEDVITNKTYPVVVYEGHIADELNVGDGTIGLLELHNQKYYFNGVRTYQDAKRIDRTKRKIELLMQETGLSYEKVMMEYTLEILAEMLSDSLPFRVQEEDIPLYEELGLAHLPLYAEDFVGFYKEKTAGKKGNTLRKYRDSLKDVNELLMRNGYTDLKPIDEKTWIRLLSKEFFDMYEIMTKTLITDLISSLKAFAGWMKKNQKNTLWTGLAEFIKEEESQFISAVQFHNSFFPTYHREMARSSSEAVNILRGDISPNSEIIEGAFEIIKQNKQSFRVRQISVKGSRVKKENRNLEYTISARDAQIKHAEEGLLFYGRIAIGRKNLWELLTIDKAYPRSARKFIEK